MVYLYYTSSLKYTIVVGNPRFDSLTVPFQANNILKTTLSNKYNIFSYYAGLKEKESRSMREREREREDKTRKRKNASMFLLSKSL